MTGGSTFEHSRIGQAHTGQARPVWLQHTSHILCDYSTPPTSGAHRSSTTCVITTHLPHLQELNFYPPRTLTCLKTMVHEVLLVIFYEHRKSVQSLCELKKCLMRPSNVTIDRSAMNRQPVSHRSLAFQSMINNAWQITERKTRIWKRDCYRSSCKWSVGSYRLSEGTWTTVHCDTHRHLPAFRTQQQ